MLRVTVLRVVGVWGYHVTRGLWHPSDVCKRPTGALRRQRGPVMPRSPEGCVRNEIGVRGSCVSVVALVWQAGDGFSVPSGSQGRTVPEWGGRARVLATSVGKHRSAAAGAAGSCWSRVVLVITHKRHGGRRVRVSPRGPCAACPECCREKCLVASIGRVRCMYICMPT